MKPDTSHWRENGAYEYMNTLSVEDLAWECLRRNTSYQDDVRQRLRVKDKDSDGDLVISRRWGLRFRRPSQPIQP